MDTAKQRFPTLGSEQVFLFSQASLQDYQECPRRFQLRYLLKAAWPAVQAEPVREQERHIRRGERFHRLAQQALLGLPHEHLTSLAAADPDDLLSLWWESFSQSMPQFSGEKRFIELMVQAPLGRHRLMAKYDFILLSGNERLTILDWKTNQKLPRKDWLLNRWQTRIYQYLAVRAASGFINKKALEPAQVEMVYWFTNFPNSAIRLPYSSKQYQRDEADLLSVVTEIEQLTAEDFQKTSDERQCQFCVFRSYCDRGISAGVTADHAADFDNEADFNFDFEQIAEISF